MEVAAIHCNGIDEVDSKFDGCDVLDGIVAVAYVVCIRNNRAPVHGEGQTNWIKFIPFVCPSQVTSHKSMLHRRHRPPAIEHPCMVTDGRIGKNLLHSSVRRIPHISPRQTDRPSKTTDLSSRGRDLWREILLEQLVLAGRV